MRQIQEERFAYGTCLGEIQTWLQVVGASMLVTSGLAGHASGQSVIILICFNLFTEWNEEAEEMTHEAKREGSSWNNFQGEGK